VIQRKTGLYLSAAGSFALAIGVGLQNWAHGNHAHFATGFFLGLSIVLLIGGTMRKPREIPK